MVDWQQDLEQAVALGRRAAVGGQVASYIPELARVHPNQVGLAVVTPAGELYSAGEARVPFTLQSVSKVITLIFALMEVGEEGVFARVGMEPTGDPFNSIVRLETRQQTPLNPFINAGAIAVADLILGDNLAARIDRYLQFVRELAGNPSLAIDEQVAASEYATSHRNRALAHFMKDAGLLDGTVEDALRFYITQCAVTVTAEDLARIGARLAYPDGRIPRHILRTTLAIMTTCGLYDGSGEFAVRVGMAAKSGVGGGILAVVPGRVAAAAFGPALDERGNSKAGVAMLQELSERRGLSLFDAYAVQRAR